MNNYFFPALRRIHCTSFFLLIGLIPIQGKSQSISAQVIASTGGYGTNATGSLSYTIGETNTQTLSTATHMLTQGFQQPIEIQLLNVKAFLQGYYMGSSSMNDVLYNQGEYTNPSNIADSITVELHEATPPYAMLFQTKTILLQNGTASVKGLGVIGQSNYIVIKHRNSLETWSANPVLISANSTYDFSNAATKAFGDNQVEVDPGVWALYSGDVNQDGGVDAFDYLLLDPDIINGAFGYLDTDLNGDGTVDAFDYLVLDPNIVSGVGAATP